MGRIESRGGAARLSRPVALARVMRLLAFVWGIVGWRRRGRSVTAVLSVVLGLPGMLAAIGFVVLPFEVLVPGLR